MTIVVICRAGAGVCCPSRCIFRVALCFSKAAFCCAYFWDSPALPEHPCGEAEAPHGLHFLPRGSPGSGLEHQAGVCGTPEQARGAHAEISGAKGHHRRGEERRGLWWSPGEATAEQGGQRPGQRRPGREPEQGSQAGQLFSLPVFVGTADGRGVSAEEALPPDTCWDRREQHLNT